MNINSVLSTYLSPTIKTEREQGGDFTGFIKDSILKVNDLQLESDKLDAGFASGEVDIHEVMIAAQKSEIALQFTLEIKNKLLDAYKEIMRLQV